MLAEAMGSDSSVGSKRSIIEIDRQSLLQQQQQQQQELRQLSFEDESQEPPSLVLSSPNDQVQDNPPSPNSFKKVKFHSTQSETSMGKEQEVGSQRAEEILGSFSGKMVTTSSDETLECEKTSEYSGQEVGNFQEKGKGVGSLTAGKQNQENKENVKYCGESEVGFSGIDELGKQEVSGEWEADLPGGVSVFGVETKSLLEVKKKHLLAELEAGLLFKDKARLEGVSGLDTEAGISGSLKGVDESVRPSIKVEVIDETALVETVPVAKTSVGGLKVMEKNDKKKEKQEINGKKAKRRNRKGKDLTKGLEISGREQTETQVGVDWNRMTLGSDGQKVENQMKRKYSREEMEALRFLNPVEQKRMWREIFDGLAHAVVKEYNGLVNLKLQKNIPIKCNPQQQTGMMECPPIFLGELSSEHVDSDLKNNEEDGIKNINVMDPACTSNTEAEGAYHVYEEGEGSEEYDTDEDYSSIQRPALLVEGEPDFESGPPQDGWEYLRRVRWEAAHIPKVTVAKPDRNKVNKEQSIYMPHIPDIAKCPEHLLPLKQWEDAFLVDFSELRQILLQNEGSRITTSNKQQPKAIVHEENASFPEFAESIILEKFTNLTTDEDYPIKPYDGTSLEDPVDQPSLSDSSSENPNSKRDANDSLSSYPSLSSILALDSVARVSMLKKRINLAETMDSLSKSDCLWLFSLCAAVDTPLDGDTSAALRSLLRKCANLRAGKSELDDEVIMLNILATISGRFFGQSEC